MADGASPIGELVRRLRVQRGLSQAELNRAAGLSSGYVSMLESGARGTRIRKDQVLKLAHGLDLSVADTERLLKTTGHMDGQGARPPGRPTFEAFIAGDPLLTRNQKEMLVRLYRSYVPADHR